MNEITLTETPVRTVIPARVMLAVDGDGGPDTDRFGAAVAALLTVRAALGGGDAPVEGTYDARDGDWDLERPDAWTWTLAIEAPHGVEAGADTGDDRVRAELRPAVDVVAVVHRGPYEAEAPTLAALRAFAAGHGLRVAGPHTERYLTDPGTTPPDDLRTLLWYPVGA